MKFLLTLLLTCLYLNADATAGKQVYLENCANCHSTTMKGGEGKDFNVVSYTRKKEEIIAYVKNPQIMYAKFGYNANSMPKLPLKKKQISDVADFIYSLQKFKKWMKNK